MIVFEKRHVSVRELPLVAMIDVVFILIFFFMLTTQFMPVESMEIKLPVASGGSAVASKHLVRVVLYEDGTMTYGERATDMPGLKETLKTALADNTKQPMMVYADEGVPLAKLVEVLDAVALLGGESVYVRPLPKTVTPVVGGGG